jgi:hypothetical protein
VNGGFSPRATQCRFTRLGASIAHKAHAVSHSIPGIPKENDDRFNPKTSS